MAEVGHHHRDTAGEDSHHQGMAEDSRHQGMAAEAGLDPMFLPLAATW